MSSKPERSQLSASRSEAADRRRRCPARHHHPLPVAPENAASVYPSYTANRAVNAVPWVCEAPSGIRTTADLPQIIPVLV
ncbi:hypothetical protein [Streptomyces sp. NL15-2K]|uniref:hypothetical protein n=1 Tax=Streptomyces sp. NL15-2K TaxID=376149 RepID=UPI0011CFB01D|nr:hypothetical protein [Kutzneria buriramensis]WKX15403.1 hypothetical protein Q4V64_51090 [Kutzneria buriramensis]